MSEQTGGSSGLWDCIIRTSGPSVITDGFYYSTKFCTAREAPPRSPTPYPFYNNVKCTLSHSRLEERCNPFLGPWNEVNE